MIIIDYMLEKGGNEYRPVMRIYSKEELIHQISKLRKGYYYVVGRDIKNNADIPVAYEECGVEFTDKINTDIQVNPITFKVKDKMQEKEIDDER